MVCVSPRRLVRWNVRGAVELWRSVPEDHEDHAAVAERLAVVKAEFEKLLVRYEKRGSFYEKKGRLAEAVLYYRLALELVQGRVDQQGAGSADGMAEGHGTTVDIHLVPIEIQVTHEFL